MPDHSAKMVGSLPGTPSPFPWATCLPYPSSTDLHGPKSPAICHSRPLSGPHRAVLWTLKWLYHRSVFHWISPGMPVLPSVPASQASEKGITWWKNKKAFRWRPTCVCACFSHGRCFAIPWTVARQASLSMEFSRQEYWSGLPCPPPRDLLNPEIEPVSLVSPTLPAGSWPLAPPWKPLSVRLILKKICWSLSCVQFFVILWTVARQSPQSTGFPRQEYWSGLPFPSPGELPNPRIEPGLPHCRWILYHLSHQGSPNRLTHTQFTSAVSHSLLLASSTWGQGVEGPSADSLGIPFCSSFH